MAKFQLNLTLAGSALLGQVMTSKVLTFTQMALGDGVYSGGAWNLTALVSEKKRVDITSAVAAAGSGEALLRSTLTYADLPDTFYWREFGIYAKDPSGGPDILYAYANAGDDYDTIGGSGALREIILRARVAISDVSDLTVTVQSGSTVYVSAEELADAIAEVNASIEVIQTIIQQVTGVDPSDPEAEPPSGSMVVTLTHAKSGTVHAFTGLEGRTGLVPCQFKATAGYTAGDTATIDGTVYTIVLTGADDPETDLFVSGRSILVDVDTGSKTINFKAGGGLTKAKLALATATEAEVFVGKTFYAGGKTLRTGTALSEATDVAPENLFNGKKAYTNGGKLVTGTALSTATDVAAGNLFNGKKAYDNNGNLVTGTALSQAVNVNANNIPSGVTAYNQAGQRITGNGSQVFKYKSGSCFLNGSSKSISCDFHIWMVALYGGSWLSDCVLFTGTSNSGSTTFYKCPDSDFIDQENYQGTISVSGGNYATIWYNAGDGCSIYYYVVGV